MSDPQASRKFQIKMLVICLSSALGIAIIVSFFGHHHHHDHWKRSLPHPNEPIIESRGIGPEHGSGSMTSQLYRRSLINDDDNNLSKRMWDCRYNGNPVPCHTIGYRRSLNHDDHDTLSKRSDDENTLSKRMWDCRYNGNPVPCHTIGYRRSEINDDDDDILSKRMVDCKYNGKPVPCSSIGPRPIPAIKGVN